MDIYDILRYGYYDECGKYIVVNSKISEKKYDKPLTSDNAERLTQNEIKEMIKNWRKNNV